MDKIFRHLKVDIYKNQKTKFHNCNSSTGNLIFLQQKKEHEVVFKAVYGFSSLQPTLYFYPT